MKLGETIKIFRIANDYTNKQFAELCGVSSTYVTEVENNHKTPSYDMLKKMAVELKVMVSKIIWIHEIFEEQT